LAGALFLKLLLPLVSSWSIFLSLLNGDLFFKLRDRTRPLQVSSCENGQCPCLPHVSPPHYIHYDFRQTISRVAKYVHKGYLIQPKFSLKSMSWQNNSKRYVWLWLYAKVTDFGTKLMLVKSLLIIYAKISWNSTILCQKIDSIHP
jgi:hypothetical protein